MKDDVIAREARLSARLARLSSEKQILLEKRLQGRAAPEEASQHGQTAARSASLVPMQTGDASKRPLFFVHPGNGQVLCYKDLIQHLGPSQPFYGLQARGLDGDEEPDTQVEEMAAHYTRLIQSVQPQGPYLLGGWCVGGVVALEVAQQLGAQGQHVALLAVINSRLPLGNGTGLSGAASMVSFALSLGLPLKYEPYEQLGLDEQLTHAVKYLESLQLDEQLARVLEQAKSAHILPSDAGADKIAHLYRIYQSITRAIRRYVPRAYTGPIVLFKADEQIVEGVSAQDWGALGAGGVEVLIVPGNHYTMIHEPHVGILAEHLNRYLSSD